MQTERLLLRPWRETDAASLFKYAQDPAIGPVAGWPAHTSVEDSRLVIRNVFCAPETYAVVLKASNEPIGCVGIMFADNVNSCYKKEGDAEIGYWIGVPYWGQGLIPEAVKCLLARCFDDLGLQRVWCSCYDGNVKSRRVMDKCGFAFHHTETNKISALGDARTEHYTLLTKEAWEKLSR
ncbi:MAG: GNAT family N-acetyltransferase [Prevotellamassilia sp.]|nr:GNAT family N-acetyltransferase [Prevotellamassilia sp.]